MSPDPQPAINPCEQESAGFLTCDGVNQVVVPFPSGGPWRVLVTNGVITFENAAGGGGGVEAAPAPRESNGAGKDESQDVT